MGRVARLRKCLAGSTFSARGYFAAKKHSNIQILPKALPRDLIPPVLLRRLRSSLWISMQVQFKSDELKFLSQGKDLQEPLEKSFLDEKNYFRFRIADENYILRFDPWGDMRQENVTYRTIKKVRRRPAKFLSIEDISQLISYLCGTINDWKGDKLWLMICSEYNETIS